MEMIAKITLSRIELTTHVVQRNGVTLGLDFGEGVLLLVLHDGTCGFPLDPDLARPHDVGLEVNVSNEGVMAFVTIFRH